MRGPASLAEYLAGRQLLLVLDNCDHLVDAGAELAESEDLPARDGRRASRPAAIETGLPATGQARQQAERSRWRPPTPTVSRSRSATVGTVPPRVSRREGHLSPQTKITITKKRPVMVIFDVVGSRPTFPVDLV